MEEHFTCYFKNNESSAYSDYLVKSGHNFNSDFVILHSKIKNPLKLIGIILDKISLNNQSEVKGSLLLNILKQNFGSVLFYYFSTPKTIRLNLVLKYFRMVLWYLN